jgi:methyltransferase-like protein
MVAEMLRYHTRNIAPAAERIEQAQAMLAFLSTVRPGKGAYALLLREELESLAKRRPESLIHDELSEVQAPLYFREFADRAARHGLQYLGEADFFEMLDMAEAPEAQAALRNLAGDAIEREQYLDFVKGRRFRQTLLCHAETPLRRKVESAQVRQFLIGVGRRRNQEQPPEGHPLAKAVFAAVTEAWPGVLSFDELRERSGADDEELLSDLVLAFFAAGQFQAHVYRWPFAATPGPFPRASALARAQAAEDAFVSNLCHNTVHLESELSRQLVQALDGTRDRAALLELLRGTLEVDLERGLEGLAKLGLLEA